jgi:hypothetical protein
MRRKQKLLGPHWRSKMSVESSPSIRFLTKHPDCEAGSARQTFLNKLYNVWRGAADKLPRDLYYRDPVQRLAM